MQGEPAIAGPTMAGIATYNLAHGAPVDRTRFEAARPVQTIAANAPTRAEPAPIEHVAPTEAAAMPPVLQPPAAPPPQPVEFKPFVLPPESGLIMVETAASQQASACPPSAEESEKPTGARRRRPPRQVIRDEPLVMVETTNKH